MFSVFLVTPGVGARVSERMDGTERLLGGMCVLLGNMTNVLLWWYLNRLFR